ncbi:hypothetical protein NQ317_000502 [Molorchus minor]|uniref:Endonuclease/exonuclease/phosphatase domain-containing protein n=1 Tax=Molorchus minor TaxID=1323400 RepID=A0ABQ9JM57_9CUCU|nr:hypothetical protein NQ317_000502 [Molorchus minor]
MEFRVYYQNARGLRTKTQNFFTSSVSSAADIICVTETWLNNGVHDGELFDLDTFQVFRRDRDLTSSAKQDGGGILIAVRRRFATQMCKTWFSQGICEDMWVSVFLTSKVKVNVCCVYVPPYASEENLTAHLNNVSRIVDQHPNEYFFIVGDYNAPKLTWNFNTQKNCFVVSDISDPFGESLADTYNFLLLNQFNGILNSRDLVFSNIIGVNVTACDLPFVPEDPYHKSLNIEINLTDELNLKGKASYRTYKFHLANYDNINTELSNINWENLFHGLNTNESVSVFYTQLQQTIARNVPLKTVNNKYPNWFFRNTKNRIKEKYKLHKRWKNYKNDLDYIAFSNLRKLVKTAIKTDYREYIIHTENNIKDNTKCFWSFIANKHKSKSIPTSVSYDNNISCTDKDIANAFSSYFGSVYEPSSTPSNIELTEEACMSLNIQFISTSQIENHLNKLGISKGAGPDGMLANSKLRIAYVIRRYIQEVYSRVYSFFLERKKEQCTPFGIYAAPVGIADDGAAYIPKRCALFLLSFKKKEYTNHNIDHRQ